jgi:hypothetical protein
MVRNALLNANSSHESIINAENILITELPLAFPAGVIPIDGTMTPVAQIVTLLTSHRDGLLAGDQLRAQLHNTVTGTDAQLTAVQTAVRGIEAFAAGTLGQTSQNYAKLGFTPTKKPVKTAAVKAEAAVKGNATRTARGTKGKNQKKSIHGTVPPPTETPAKK